MSKEDPGHRDTTDGHRARGAGDRGNDSLPSGPTLSASLVLRSEGTTRSTAGKLRKKITPLYIFIYIRGIRESSVLQKENAFMESSMRPHDAPFQRAQRLRS